MKLTFNATALEEIMHLFHTLTGMRFVILGTDFKEIASFPPNPCAFCRCINEHPLLEDKCRTNDLRDFTACKNSKDTVVCKCHMGLIKGIVPIFSHSDHIACYIMFGQVADRKDKRELNRIIERVNLQNGVLVKSNQIEYKSSEQIKAATRLLEFCAEHIMLKDMINVEKSQQFVRAKEYIDEHLSEDLDIRTICAYAATSRTDLYNVFRREHNVGIAHYIKEQRMKKAKELLKNTNLSVAEISGKVGFSNYNYFSRIFKQHFGVSPHSYRNSRDSRQ